MFLERKNIAKPIYCTLARRGYVFFLLLLKTGVSETYLILNWLQEKKVGKSVSENTSQSGIGVL